MQPPSMSAAIAALHAEFEVETAHSPSLAREAFELRHQVYCLEKQYEAGANGMESDAFDRHSRHVLVRCRSTGEALGTTRLILANPATLQTSFPMQEVCPPSLFDRLPLATTAEVSRFAISKQRRQMSAAAASLMRLALVQGLVQASQELGLTHWLAVMEPSLLRLLQGTAIHFQPLGPVVEYHGRRQPACAELHGLLARMAHERREVWEFVTASGRFWPEREMVPLAA